MYRIPGLVMRCIGLGLFGLCDRGCSFLFHGSDIISIMVISLSGICNISLICNLMCSEWRWLLFIS